MMAEVAAMYYQEGLSQQQIADRIAVSRSMVSYMLLEARQAGVVQIRINRPIPRDLQLELELENRFAIREAYVVVGGDAGYSEILELMGCCAESILGEILQDGMVLGISAGTSVSSAVRMLRPRRLPRVRVVQLTGGFGAPHRSFDAAEQCMLAASAFGAHYHYLNAPVIVENGPVAEALRQDRSIRAVLDLAAQTQVALMGIGTIEPLASTQFHAGYLSYDDLRQMEKLGVVGGLCTSFFSLEGEHIPVPWIDPRVIGVSWDEMRRFETVIALGAGRAKAKAVLGAARSGIVDVLITDDKAAREALLLLDD